MHIFEYSCEASERETENPNSMIDGLDDLEIRLGWSSGNPDQWVTGLELVVLLFRVGSPTPNANTHESSSRWGQVFSTRNSSRRENAAGYRASDRLIVSSFSRFNRTRSNFQILKYILSYAKNIIAYVINSTSRLTLLRNQDSSRQRENSKTDRLSM